MNNTYAVFKVIRKKLPGKPYPFLTQIDTIKDSNLINAKIRAAAKAKVPIKDIQLIPYK